MTGAQFESQFTGVQGGRKTVQNRSKYREMFRVRCAFWLVFGSRRRLDQDSPPRCILPGLARHGEASLPLTLVLSQGAPGLKFPHNRILFRSNPSQVGDLPSGNFWIFTQQVRGHRGATLETGEEQWSRSNVREGRFSSLRPSVFSFDPFRSGKVYFGGKAAAAPTLFWHRATGRIHHV